MRGLDSFKKAAKALTLGAVVITAQPEKNPDIAQTKPVGIREALRKMEGQQRNVLPDGRTFVISDSMPPEQKEEKKDQKSVEGA
ncbi:MAG TPA: hypothetical protein VG102_00925 [Candidatus Paceibacterota bacterium]|nr:hypothetical protein [Candidatus Paceibacterota bacterium]